jgi:hypothetical protein
MLQTLQQPADITPLSANRTFGFISVLKNSVIKLFTVKSKLKSTVFYVTASNSEYIALNG